jgi:RHS repeat-associated protein
LPFGETLGATATVANPFQFVGRSGVMTMGNGLDYMRARFYAPFQGRFTSVDPLGAGGGANIYEYGGNNPVNSIDPVGFSYVDINFSFGLPVFLGVTGGVQFDTETGAAFPYLGGGVMTPGLSAALTVSTQSPTPGLGWGLQVSAGPAVQTGNSFLDHGRLDPLNATNRFLEFGAGTPGASLTAYYVFTLDQLRELLRPAPPLLSSLGLLFEGTANAAEGPPTETASTEDVSSIDPNFISGPGGYGAPGFVSVDSSLPYKIGFENDATATAPAQVVTVTEQLDPGLDWSSFQLGDFSFGGLMYAVRAGLTSFNTVIDATSTVGVYVDVDAQFDDDTGMLTWTFTSIDPATLDVPIGNPEEGFLPPDSPPPQGEGWISYTVSPLATDATGTIINAEGTVFFDGTPLNTAELSNTIDAGAPTSSVSSLPAVTVTPSFPVAWSGADDPNGPGVGGYDVYVSENGGPFTLWLTDTPLTTAIYDGQYGNTYSFYSLAIDNAGNQQSDPTTAEATTSVQQPVPTTVSLTTDHPAGSTYGQAVTFTASVSETPAGASPPTGTVQFLVDNSDYGPPVALSGGSASLIVSSLGAGLHSVAADYASDNILIASSITAGSLPQTVSPAPLTITAEPETKVYGQADPVLAYQASGFQLGDTAATALSGGLARASGEDVDLGPYAINQGTLAADGNYTVNFTPSLLTITPATLTVSANPQTKVYGQPDPVLTYQASGLEFGDTAATALSGGLTRAGGEDVAGGPYAIGQGTLAADSDYTINFIPSTLSITPAALTVSADPQTMVYGGTLPAFTASYTGFVNGDSVTSLTALPTLSTSATAASPVGTYSINVSGAVDPNYAISYVAGTLTIGSATLTWNGVANGNWTDAQWSGADLPYPNETVNAIISTPSVIQVASGQAANALTIQAGGQVAVAAGASLAITTGASVTGGGTLSVDPNGAFSSGGTLTLDTGGSLIGGPITAAAYQLNAGTASADLSGPGSLTKDTGGTVTLSGANSYAGGTVVNAGTLIATSASALPNGSSLTIGAGAGSLFAASPAVSSPPGAGLAAVAPDMAATSETSTPIVIASTPAGTSVPAPAASTLSMVLERQVENLSYGPRPAALSRAAIDAVFASHRPALDQAAAPARSTGSAGAWAWWLAANGSSGDSSGQNQQTEAKIAALDRVLAQYGL